MIRTLYRRSDGTVDAAITPEQGLAALREGEDGLLWVDLVEEPLASAEQILHDVFQFHPLAVDDALRESHVPKIDDWGEYLYVTLHSITHGADTWEELSTLEVDIFIGRGFIVTYQSRPVSSVERVWGMVQRDARHLTKGADNILYLLADELVADYFPV
ncbi:MAG: CorA family divalent cation transporter, partial [Anaerolineae bacterium]